MGGGCKCDLGYKGNLCDKCDSDKYFMENETSETQKPSCQRCHSGCKGCTGKGDDKCIACATGYIMVDEVVEEEDEEEKKEDNQKLHQKTDRRRSRQLFYNQNGGQTRS